VVTFFWSFWVTWAAPLVLYIRRMERVPLLTFASLANVGGGAAVITTIAVAWTVMAFRAETPARRQPGTDLSPMGGLLQRLRRARHGAGELHGSVQDRSARTTRRV
jgi:hypothetical protein